MEDDPRDYLIDMLHRVREIAALDDESAFEALAELIDELRFGVDWQRERAREVLAEVRAEAEFLESAVKRGVPLPSWWAGRDLMRRLEELGSRWSPEIRRQFAGDIAEVRHASEPIARAATAHAAKGIITTSLTEHIVNTMVAERILRDMKAVEDMLAAIGGSEPHASEIRRARERAARYRWQRKVDEAEVVEAGGNTKKAQRLRAEATVLLKQDWLRAFPDETPPVQ